MRGGNSICGIIKMGEKEGIMPDSIEDDYEIPTPVPEVTIDDVEEEEDDSWFPEIRKKKKETPFYDIIFYRRYG